MFKRTVFPPSKKENEIFRESPIRAVFSIFTPVLSISSSCSLYLERTEGQTD